MRPKRIPQSKSKSQTPHPLAMCECIHSSRKHVHGIGRCVGFTEFSDAMRKCPCKSFVLFQEPIANGTETPQETLSEPTAPQVPSSPRICDCGHLIADHEDGALCHFCKCTVPLFSVPEVPLVHIRLEQAGWCIAEGHVHSPIPNKDVATQPDPVVVALYLISHAKGPINVAW